MTVYQKKFRLTREKPPENVVYTLVYTKVYTTFFTALSITLSQPFKIQIRPLRSGGRT